MSRVTCVSRVTFLEIATGYSNFSRVTCSKIVTGYKKMSRVTFYNFCSLEKSALHGHFPVYFKICFSLKYGFKPGMKFEGIVKVKRSECFSRQKNTSSSENLWFPLLKTKYN